MRAVKGSLGHPLRGDGGFEERDGMWVSVGLLCSRNAHDRNVLVGLMARLGKSIAKQSEGWVGEKYLSVGGRVRRLRAVEDQSAPIPEEKTSIMSSRLRPGERS